MAKKSTPAETEIQKKPKTEKKSKPVKAESTAPKILVEDDRSGMSKESFKRAMLDNLLCLQGRTLNRATPVDLFRALRDLGAERRIAARAAAAGNMIGALPVLGQCEEILRLRPGVVDQLGVDAMIGDHREAEAFERGAKVLRELIGGQRHGNNGYSGSHANMFHC